ncbi:MAG: hypothetical protein C0407_11310 [Desulfobacca sp.]|nr:hypothetical protein [Desulfobacca sp.]
MRISTDMMFNHLSQGLKDNLTEMDTLSNQISTGKKILKTSDDVLGTLRAMAYKLSISQNNQAEQNITGTDNYLNFNNTVLTQISSALVSLKRLTTQPGGTAVDRTYYSTQAATLRDNLLELSNSTYLNSSIFSGSLSDNSAYTYDIVAFRYYYQGDSQQKSISLGSGITATAINVVGNSTDPNSITPFSFPSLATTTLADGSVATFASAADIPHNSRIITATITDPSNNVDTFNFSNVIDIANYIAHAWENQDVDGVTALTAQQSKNRIEALAGALDKVQSQLLTVQGQIGINQVQLKDQKTRLVANTLTQQNNLSTVQDADMDQTIVSLLKMTSSLNALRSASAKILSQSLFDFLR